MKGPRASLWTDKTDTRDRKSIHNNVVSIFTKLWLHTVPSSSYSLCSTSVLSIRDLVASIHMYGRKTGSVIIKHLINHTTHALPYPHRQGAGSKVVRVVALQGTLRCVCCDGRTFQAQSHPLTWACLTEGQSHRVGRQTEKCHLTKGRGLEGYV